MKLEKIVINGFKSFADKTELKISHPITAIVGPNGCGKSNVVDALKWVLGNQSPKSLRSGAMADVIFSGSGSRKPSGMAEVSLHFSDVRGLGLQEDDLLISRRLFRSGESDYQINGKSCRLRDIREMFMDTGVGVSAYSIIEQGQIDQLLKASTADRRFIFEEAAGISKFKAHKKEALRKLERTEQNLLRLADIVNEVQKQLRSIKLQAGKARNYLEYSHQLKELRVNFSLSEYNKIITGRKGKQSDLAGWQDRFSAVAANVSRCDAAMSQLTGGIMETESQINHWDGTLISARSRIEQQLERIGFLKSRIDELTDRKKNASEQIRKLTAQTRQLSAEMGACRNDLLGNQQQHKEQAAQLEHLQASLADINARCADLQTELEDEKSGIIDIVRRTAQLHNEIQSLGNYRNNLSGQKTRLSGKASQTEQQLAGWLTEKAQYQSRLEEILSVLSRLQQSLNEKRAEMDAVGDERLRLTDRIAATKEQRSAVMRELNVLRDMETRRQGLSQSLKDILAVQDAGRAYLDGIVADAVVAQTEYAQAVEAALEGFADALLVNSTGAFLQDAAIQATLDSRIRVICMDKLKPFADSADLSDCPGVLGRLAEFIRCDGRFAPLFWSLLGKTLLVQSLDTAMELAGRLGPAYRFVTPDGQVFGGGCTLTIGPVGKTDGLISRKSRILQLEEELEGLNQTINNAESALGETEHKNDHLAGLCKELRTSIYEANTEKVDAESQLRILETNIKRLTDEQPLIAEEIRVLEEEIRESVQKEHLSRQKLDELEEINRQRNAHIESLQARFDQECQIRHARNAELTEARIRLSQIQEQQKSINQRISAVQSQLQHGRTAIESARTEALGSDEQILQAERTILATEASVSELFGDKETAQTNSRRLHREIEQLTAERKQMEIHLRQFREEQATVEENVRKLELELGQLQVKEEDLLVRVQEELQIDLATAYESFRDDDVDWDLVRQEIADLRGKIERLGNVNVDAIDQQEDLEKRYEFLAAQVEDLNQSKTQLEQLIARINKESKEKFELTFEQVRMNFQLLFRKLFGGGKADVILENPEDILESGIEIVARPPGKETRTISLLSGGEKTMTAIALLFAVFKSKPSPFCVLDEVDAALDEANNERFNLIVKEFQAQSQFIVITHSKRTMGIANVLYGITMQTQGVSKKISVQFEEAGNETETAVA